ncbi:DsbA family oxidoreductase [Shewanella glacialimarina]|uniref:DsbA family oxidoreductase n=1 Tax=Shewanella glacialimarina TaxID=2590884 RepID=UPI001CF89B3D|nr:DsbA family oxidoreductase [Shewanella glacialimarina]UCX06467.1 DsbA family oxidoreductase [Shewanella glacialimarina]
MADKIKIDIISDVVCPWCIVGYEGLKQAINELGIEDKVDIEWQPFELNPDMPTEGEELRAHVARKYGSSRAASDRARINIAARGAEFGFKFNYADDMKMVNTFDAHILLNYAKGFGKQTELKIRLFNAFFSEHKDVSDRAVLANELIAVGLNPKEALPLLDNAEARAHITADKNRWLSAGINSVPTVVFNRTSALNGAHPVESYKQVLSELLAEQKT